MARTVNVTRHAERRLQIIDAALTCFAARGLDATTADICHEAGIGSGTFFHYFSTKLDVIRGIFDVGSHETSAWFTQWGPDADPLMVLLNHADHAASEAADPRTSGFALAVSAALTRPEISAALEIDQRTLREGLTPWVERARASGQIRTDWSVADTVSWLMALEDAFVGAVVGIKGFDAVVQAPALRDVVARALRP